MFDFCAVCFVLFSLLEHRLFVYVQVFCLFTVVRVQPVCFISIVCFSLFLFSFISTLFLFYFFSHYCLFVWLLFVRLLFVFLSFVYFSFDCFGFVWPCSAGCSFLFDSQSSSKLKSLQLVHACLRLHACSAASVCTPAQPPPSPSSPGTRLSCVVAVCVSLLPACSCVLLLFAPACRCCRLLRAVTFYCCVSLLSVCSRVSLLSAIFNRY